MSEMKDVEVRDPVRNSFEEKHLQEYLERITDILEISKPKYRITSGTKAGDNYIGVIYSVIIEGEKNGDIIKIETMFKVPPKDNIIRQLTNVRQFFPREDLFYREIVPSFEDFLKSKNKKFQNIPRCYLSIPDDEKEAICMEDLRARGFIMRDRLKQMDFAHTSLALSALGRFHAVSFALRDQKPEVFESKITTLTETLNRSEILTNPDFIVHFKKCGTLVKFALAEEDPKYVERFSEFEEKGLSLMEWSCDGRNAEPYAVLGHGDFWMNNMLFRYKEDSSDPEEVVFLDFQLTRYASPVLDIAYILFTNCSQELRNNHYDELIKIYHESLSSYLLELGSDPKKLFPYEAFLKHLEKFSCYVAGMAMLTIFFFTARGDDNQRVTEQVDDISVWLERIKRDDFCRNTMKNSFKDLIDRNYI